MICSVCKSKLNKFLRVKNIEKNKYFNILKCNSCGHLETKISSKVKIDQYYNLDYYGKKNKFLFLFETISKLIRLSRIRNLIFLKNKKIIDIGFGRGVEITTLRKKNITYGVEINKKYFKKLNKLGVKTFLFKNFIKKNFIKKFDVIMMWHNLEHQKNINIVLKKCKEIIKSNGILILEVPNSSSFQAKIDQKNWLYWDVPRHIHHFSTKSLNLALKNNHFTPVKINTFSLEYGVFGMLNSIINFFVKEKNLLFKEIQNNKRKKINKINFYFLMFSAFLLFPFAFIFEFISSFIFNKGSVIHIVAKKIN